MAESPPPSYASAIRQMKNNEDEPLLGDASRLRRRLSPWRRIFIVVGGAFLTACAILGLEIGIYSQVVPIPDLRPTVKIAVIGAGPAGVACVGALEREFEAAKRKGARRVKITIFEQKEKVGGRMVPSGNESSTFFRSWSSGIEDFASGDLLSSSILQGKMKTLLGSLPKDHVAKEVGFFDGEQMVAQLPRPVGDISWARYLGLIFKYGISIWRAKNVHDGPIDGLYRFLNLKGIYENISEMLQSAGLTESISMTAVQKLKNSGISDKYTSEILTPQLARHIGQEIPEISALALALAIDREAQVSSGLSNSKLGNALHRYLQLSGAKIELSTKILGMKRRAIDLVDEKWILEIEAPTQEVELEAYDHVVLAAPLANNFRDIIGNYEISKDAISYRKVWVTFVIVDGGWDASLFSGAKVDQILPIKTNTLPSELRSVKEISHLRDVYGPDLMLTPTHSYISMMRSFYRILSEKPLPRGTVGHFFGASTSMVVHEELVEEAYPLLWPREVLYTDVKFEVGKDLWWTGGYEVAMSGVDVAWVVGENVGRLVAREVLAKSSKKEKK